MSELATNCLSDYQRARARNIERNNAKLRALGLISAAEERNSNATAWGRPTPKTVQSLRRREWGGDDSDSDLSDGEAETSSSRPRKRAKRKDLMSASRRSLRLQGKAPSGKTQGLDLRTKKSVSLEDMKEERRQRREEYRQARQRAAIEHASLGAAKAARENPTATYEHCLMRCRTMSENQLLNRIRTIERAVGKHCVIKMAIMTSCLQDEGKWELVPIAKAALERLKALKPLPKDD